MLFGVDFMSGKANPFQSPSGKTRNAQKFVEAANSLLGSSASAAMILAISALLGGLSESRAASEEELEQRFHNDVKPLFDQFCFRCHGEKKQKGGINFENFENFSQIKNRLDLWENAMERIQSYEMPPEGSKQPSYDQFQTMMSWMRSLPKPEIDCNKLASDRTQSYYRGYVMSRRLTRQEYGNSLRDLVGVNLPVSQILPKDGAGGEGFDTNGDTLFTSPLALERYMECADTALRKVLPGDCEMPAAEYSSARASILTVVPGPGLTPQESANIIVENFARKAFRRSVQPDEVRRYLELFDNAFERHGSFDDAIRLSLNGILLSPNFLFLAEPSPDEGGVHPLGPFQLAARLSYFIWASTPDDRLLDLAESGELLKEDVYRSEIYRMLADPKARGLSERFAMQWLELESLGEASKLDPVKFPEFTPQLIDEMKEEVVVFFHHLFSEDRPVTELFDADYTFASPALAEIYGLDLPTPETGEFQRVALKNQPERGGILGMAAVHASTSYPLRTSPVLRGKWILESILGDRIPPPPPNVPALEVDDGKISAASLREQLELHRTQPDCAACHNRMDPLGFGMENFDPLGRWRESMEGVKIDATGTLPSGKTINGPGELKQALMDQKDKALRHMVKKMVGYAFGRALNKFDQCVIDDTMEKLQSNQYRASLMVETIATSYAFRHRYYPKSE